MKLCRTALAVLVLILHSQIALSPASPAEGPLARLGVFRGSGKPGLVAEYEKWLGVPVKYALDFTGRSSLSATNPWGGIRNPAWVCSQWQDRSSTLILSTAMLPNSNFSLAAGARGLYDDHWQQFGKTLVANGCEDFIIRLGWEFNGKFYPWAAGGKEASFVSYWRRIVDVLRKVPGSRFRFDWCPLAGQENANVQAAWPGAAYVDVIGLDSYDTAKETMTNQDERWAFQLSRPYGLDWLKKFATSQGKPIALPEWGVTTRKNDNIGGGDNPKYITRMWEWMKENNVLYSSYFEVDAADANHRLMTNEFPKASAEYRRLVNAGV